MSEDKPNPDGQVDANQSPNSGIGCLGCLGLIGLVSLQIAWFLFCGAAIFACAIVVFAVIKWAFGVVFG
jgi:hypothetical protein